MKKIAIFTVLTLFLALPVFGAGFENVNYASIKEIPADWQMRLDYDGRTDGQPVYLGYAQKGVAASADGWIVYKFTYDGSDQVTLRQSYYGVWDDRASYTYE